MSASDIRSRALNLTTLPEENPSPVLRVDPQGRVLYVNTAARRLLGISDGPGERVSDDLAARITNAWETSKVVKHRIEVNEHFYVLTIVAVEAEGYLNLYGRDVTEEVTAARYAEDLSRFPEENPNPVMRVQKDGQLLYANRPARSVNGLIGADGKIAAPAIATALRTAIRDNVNLGIEVDFDGTCLAFFVTPIGGRDYVNIYGRDITKERRAEHETRSLARFPEENPNPVLRIGRTGSTLFANKAARSLPDLLSPSDGRLTASLGSVVMEALSSGQHRYSEYQSGERLYAFAVTVVPGEDYVNVYGRDITEERRASLEVIRIKNFNQGILDNLTNGIITVDGKLVVTSANPAATRILGVEIADRCGEPLDRLLGPMNDWIGNSAREALRSDDPVALLDQRYVGPAGDEVSMNLTAVPFRTGETGGTGAILVLEDITRETRMKGTMVRFMSDTVVQRLLEAGDSLLSGTTQDVSILFSDIRDFTALSERLGASDMVAVLNSYFADMVDVVFENSGTLDKFIGDAIMAVFGAPFQSSDDADNAVRAANEMMRRLLHSNISRRKEGRPEIDIGIGIDSGSVVAGTIGSPRRMEYTVIGEHVNLAARIESINKFYGTNILLSEFTKRVLRSDCLLREIDLVRVPGAEMPVRVFEALDFHSEATFPNMDRCLEQFAIGLEAYRAKSWREGAEAFGRALNANPGDRPTQIFLSRCWAHLARPPGPDWSPVTTLIK